MRIPLRHADFEHGAFTKIAKALRKVWPRDPLSLMQSQQMLAVLLGYHSLHDARREASTDVPVAEATFSMSTFTRAVAWRLFLGHGIDLLAARAIVEKMHLHELSVARSTVEACMQRRAEAQFDALRQRGLMVFHDEYHDYLNAREPWPAQTPALLRHGLPPYRWAIYPDRRLFLWDKLVAQIELLPEDFAEELRQAGRIGNPTGGTDAADADGAIATFMMDALLPAACLPLGEALASGALGPWDVARQWQVKWIVSRDASVIGTCLVADRLGAMVPRVFAADGMDAYAALAGLLCGESVPATSPAMMQFTSHARTSAGVTEPVWLVDREALRRLQAEPRDREPESTLGSTPWPPTLALWRDGDSVWVTEAAGHAEGARHFSEQGQTYVATAAFDVATQSRLSREPIFATFEVPARWEVEVAAERGIPALGNRWHDTVQAWFEDRLGQVEAQMATPAGAEALLQLVRASLAPAALDGLTERAIAEELPLRFMNDESQDAEDVADGEMLVTVRREALRRAEWLGRAVHVTMPGLQDFSLLSLGYLTLLANRESFDSRYAGMVDAPATADWLAQSRLLATMLVAEALSGHTLQERALACAMAPVLGVAGTAQSSAAANTEALGVWYRSACVVERQLEDAHRQLKAVAEWRAVEVRAARQREGGQFLRTGARIPATQPEAPGAALAKMVRMGRSSGAAMTSVQQSMSDFQITPG